MRASLDPHTGSAPNPADSLATRLVRQLNERYVEHAWRVDRTLAPQCIDERSWLSLDERTRARVARFPMALIAPPLGVEGIQCSQARACEDTVVANRVVLADTATAVRDLSRYTLIVTWQLAHCAKDAWIVMGLPRRAAHALTLLTFDEIEALSIQLAGRLRPRWDADDVFWRALLHAARASNEGRWLQLQMHALQLLGRDILPNGPNSRSGRFEDH